MNILFLLYSDISQEQRVNKELETLSEAGYKVTITDFPSNDFLVIDSYLYDRCPVRLWTRNLPKNCFFWFLKYLESVLRFVILGIKIKPDIVHCVDRLALIPGFIISRLLRIPYVYDSQEIWSEVNSVLNHPKWLWLWLERFLAKRASRVIVTDHFRLEILADILRLDRSYMFVLMSLPKLSSSSFCSREIRDDSGFHDKMLAVYCGGISPGRHLEEIIKAFQLLPEEYVLAVVGFGSKEYNRHLQQLAEVSGLSGRYRMLSPVRWSEVSEYIRSADCAFALYEKNSMNNLYSSPSKLFDALVAGVPVVATDNPLILEVVEELAAGECIDQVIPKTIAQAVQNVCTRPNRMELRKHFEHIVREKYIWEKQSDQFVDFYTELEVES